VPEPVVHHQSLPAPAADRRERSRQREELPPAEVLLAQLQRDEPRRQAGEGCAGARGEVRRDPPVGDQVDNRETLL
jgi:hypothetical protein